MSVSLPGCRRRSDRHLAMKGENMKRIIAFFAVIWLSLTLLMVTEAQQRKKQSPTRKKTGQSQKSATQGDTNKTSTQEEIKSVSKEADNPQQRAKTEEEKKKRQRLLASLPKEQGIYVWGDDDKFVEISGASLQPVSEVRVNKGGTVETSRSIMGDSLGPDEKLFVDLSKPTAGFGLGDSISKAVGRETKSEERELITLGIPNPIFVFYLKEQSESDIKSKYILVQLDAGKLPLMRVGSFSGISLRGPKTRLVPKSFNVRSFSIQTLDASLPEYFYITPEAELPPGVYGFYLPGEPFGRGEPYTRGGILPFKIRSK